METKVVMKPITNVIRGKLNKITVENIESIANGILEISREIKNPNTLKELCNDIIAGVSEGKYEFLYAYVCALLFKFAPEFKYFVKTNETNNTLCRIVNVKGIIYDEFFNIVNRSVNPDYSVDVSLDKAKKKLKSMIVFMGDLYKYNVITLEQLNSLFMINMEVIKTDSEYIDKIDRSIAVDNMVTLLSHLGVSKKIEQENILWIRQVLSELVKAKDNINTQSKFGVDKVVELSKNNWVIKSIMVDEKLVEDKKAIEIDNKLSNIILNINDIKYKHTNDHNIIPDTKIAGWNVIFI